ncbi:hypothetical protein [Lactobacillus crispatus]|uniref:hypothetical protein n=1 Tax=Lactobacillus crispatus TaxID=47770 RepID=UPI00195719CB|nr:hypothetical protein [Lactobacillus crispatus]MBM6873279.1 hypothetical protein [Lactobacillus crispatus]
MVGFEVQKQGKYVNTLPDRVKNSDLEVLTKEIKECVSSIKEADCKIKLNTSFKY